MTSIRDQLSAVRKAQFEAQFDFFNSMTTQAFESASRVAALNLAVSRDSVQRSIGATFALMNSRDPRDVLSLGGKVEEQMRSVFDYGRELLGIASGIRPYAVRPQALAMAPQLAIETTQAVARDVSNTVTEAAAAPVEAAAVAVQAAEPVAKAAVEAVAEAVPEVQAAPAAAAVTEPVVVAEPEPAPAPEALAAEAEPVPVAEPKVIAKAVGKGTARAAAIPHPAAAPVPTPGEGVEAVKLDNPPVAATKRKK